MIGLWRQWNFTYIALNPYAGSRVFVVTASNYTDPSTYVKHMDDDDWEVPIPQSKVAPTSTSDHDLLEDRGSLTSSVQRASRIKVGTPKAEATSPSLEASRERERRRPLRLPLRILMTTKTARTATPARERRARS